jgi:hypothetical protein
MVKTWLIGMGAIGLLGSAALAAGLSTRVVFPDRQIMVTDEAGKPVHDFDLYVYRCTLPGGRVDRVSKLLRQSGPAVRVRQITEEDESKPGFVRVTPDFYVPAQPEPYWIACVDKPGFKSRRWSMAQTQGDPLKIALVAGTNAGPDQCVVSEKDCNPCLTYEYSMYRNMRFTSMRCRSRASSIPRRDK